MIINIVICYENEDEVIQYAHKLSLLEGSDEITLAIVCNKPGEKGVNYLRDGLQKSGIKSFVFESDDNLGYLNGMMYGFRRLNELQIQSEWYVFSNTDVEFPQKDLIKRFRSSIACDDRNYWLVGPSVFVPSKNIHSNPYKVCRPRKLDYEKTNFGLLFPRLFDWAYHTFKPVVENSCYETTMDVYTIHGSFMFLRKELLMEVSNHPAWELLFDEEPYLGELVQENKKRVLYESSMLIYHLEGTSTGKTKLIWKYKIMRNANKRILREFY